MFAPEVRRARSVLPAISLLFLCACGDARLKKLSTGITRDSLLKIVGQGSATGDSLPHVYRAERYLLSGKMVDVLFYVPTDQKSPADSVAETSLTPIVLSDGKVSGWGWVYFDSLAKANNIPERPR
jgi:hypothetical protein